MPTRGCASLPSRLWGAPGEKKDDIVAALSRALQESGPAANQEDYYRVRESAAAYLARLGRGDVVISALRSDDERVRAMAARALRDFRPRVPGAREALEKLLLDERGEDAAREATQALRSLE